MRASLDRDRLYCQRVAIELDGKRWKPVPGATATTAEFIAARSLIHEIHQQFTGAGLGPGKVHPPSRSSGSG